MGPRLLCIAREFTLGGAAFLALRHLQRLPLPIHVDFLVTGPVSHEMRSRLPGHVNLHETGWSQALAGLHTLDLREALLDSRHECLRERYDGALGTSLFADPAACATYCLCKASSKALCLVDEVLIHPDICDEVRAAMRNAIVASDRLVSVSSGLLATLMRGEPSLSGIPCEIIPPPLLGRASDGVPSPYGDGPGNDLPRVVTVARLSFEKQIDLCLRVTGHSATGESTSCGTCWATGPSEPRWIGPYGSAGWPTGFGSRVSMPILDRGCGMQTSVSSYRGRRGVQP